jgi:hypothetical protein
MNRQFLSLVLIALFVPACNRNSRISVEAFQQLQPGQTEAQAAEILGPPTQTTEESGERTLTWTRRDLRITARFRDGKLIRREGQLDGLPLAADVAATKPAESPEPKAASDEEPRPIKINHPKGKYKDVHARCYAFATKELSDSAEDGLSGGAASETATDGGMLVGLVVHLDRTVAVGEYVTGLQGIWLNNRGQIVRSKLLGTAGRTKTEIEARRGYAVSTIHFIRDRERTYGFSLSFMAVDGDKLHAAREYSSKHVGGQGPYDKSFDRLVTARDYPIYGFQCGFNPAADHADAQRWLTGIKIYIARGLSEK